MTATVNMIISTYSLPLMGEETPSVKMTKNIKNPLFFLAFFLVTTSVSAQTDKVIDFFQAHYNSEKYDDIFNRFSPEMQKVLPLNNTKQFLNSLRTQMGKIESAEFISYKQGTYALYKTKFEKAIVALNLSVDSENRINGLFVKPYEEPSETENRAANALSGYPTEIARAIYSEANDFPNNTQLSIALIKDDVTHYYGVIKHNDTLKTCRNEDKIFEIGSITSVSVTR